MSLTHRFFLPVEDPFASRMVFSGANGHHLRTSEGNRVVCATSGLWNVPLGYGHPSIRQSLLEAYDRASYLSNFRMTHEFAELSSQALWGFFGSEAVGRVIYATSGSAALDAALKLSRFIGRFSYMGDRQLILTIKGSYHGMTVGGHSICGEELLQDACGVDTRNVIAVDLDNPEAFRQMSQRLGKRIAAIFVEPVLGSGVVMVPQSILDTIRDLQQDFGVIVIADEVATGLFRTGHALASRSWDFQPDISIVSKALTNGAFPVSALLLSRSLLERFPADVVFPFGETQGGAPIGCAIVSTVLTLFSDPEFVSELQSDILRFRGLLESVAGFDCVVGTRQVGLMGALDLDIQGLGVASPVELVHHAVKQGILVHPGPSCLQLFPMMGRGDSYFDEIEERLSSLFLRKTRRGHG